jgi:peptidoglycan/LPS O-acetylase OafA/YrhL
MPSISYPSYLIFYPLLVFAAKEFYQLVWVNKVSVFIKQILLFAALLERIEQFLRYIFTTRVWRLGGNENI